MIDYYIASMIVHFCSLINVPLPPSPALVSDDPLSLKLNFEPAGKPGKDRRYYMEEKRNVCVVCGRDSDCIRKNIVPHEYRRSDVNLLLFEMV